MHLAATSRPGARPPRSRRSRPRTASCGRSRWTWLPRSVPAAAPLPARRRSRRRGSTPRRVNTDSWTAISSGSPRLSRPPISEYSPSTFSRTTTKSIRRSRAAQRARDPWEQPDRPEVDVLVEAPADRDEQPPQRHVVGHPGPPTAPRRIASWPRSWSRPSAGIIAPVARGSARSTSRIVVAERDAVAGAGRVEHGHRGGHDLAPMPSPGSTAMRWVVAMRISEQPLTTEVLLEGAGPAWLVGGRQGPAGAHGPVQAAGQR